LFICGPRFAEQPRHASSAATSQQRTLLMGKPADLRSAEGRGYLAENRWIVVCR
jgi:hypothetical protein